MMMNDYSGVIHLHSAFSYDGHEHIEEIIKAANHHKIDFLMLTDHDHLKAREEGWEGWQGNTLVIVGQEISPRFNHYLAFNITDPVAFSEDKEGKKPQKYINEVNERGGFGIIAHPDHEGTKTFHVKHYPWNDWAVYGYAGISVWDFMTDWQKSLKGYFAGLKSFFWPAYQLKGPRQITLDRWDKMNQISKTVGIGELDNHSTVRKFMGITVVTFPFWKALRFIRTHIMTKVPFTGNSLNDMQLIFDSLRYGSCYFALEYFREAKGFQFMIEQDDRRFFMGDSMIMSGQDNLIVNVPEKAKIRVIHNGREWKVVTSDQLSAKITHPGVYRVEAFLKRAGKFRPWIFSNPIFITR